MHLNDALKKGNNNFDVVRLFAALAVIFGHSFYLFRGPAEPLKNYLYYDYSGTLAVYIFFFLSGMLITKSFLQKKSITEFIKHRFFRIWPALIVCVLITVFIIGPVFTEVSLSDYFKGYVVYLENITLYKVQTLLPGVFKNNVLPGTVNGSLWTLPVEIRCYLLVLALGLFKLLNKIFLIFLLVVSIVFYESNLMQFFMLNGSKPFMFFLSGMLAYLLADEIKINYWVGLALCATCLIARFLSFDFFLYSFYVVMIYLILIFATLPFIKKIKLPGDYSYGIYIYGFLVQQSVCATLPQIGSYESMLITIPVTIILAVLSWHLIEKRFIEIGKR